MPWPWSRALFCPTAAIEERNCRGKHAVPRNHIYIQYILDTCSTSLDPTLPHRVHLVWWDVKETCTVWKHVGCKPKCMRVRAGCLGGSFQKCSYGHSHQLTPKHKGPDLAVCHCCNCLWCPIIPSSAHLPSPRWSNSHPKGQVWNHRDVECDGNRILWACGQCPGPW